MQGSAQRASATADRLRHRSVVRPAAARCCGRGAADAVLAGAAPAGSPGQAAPHDGPRLLRVHGAQRYVPSKQFAGAHRNSASQNRVHHPTGARVCFCGGVVKQANNQLHEGHAHVWSDASAVLLITVRGTAASFMSMGTSVAGSNCCMWRRPQGGSSLTASTATPMGASAWTT